MKVFRSAIFVLAVFLAVTTISNRYHEEQTPVLYEYMIHNFYEDTAAQNAVAAILLNYRMYDTMFEALILLTAIIGMKQFLPATHELQDSRQEQR